MISNKRFIVRDSGVMGRNGCFIIRNPGVMTRNGRFIVRNASPMIRQSGLIARDPPFQPINLAGIGLHLSGRSIQLRLGRHRLTTHRNLIGTQGAGDRQATQPHDTATARKPDGAAWAGEVNKVVLTVAWNLDCRPGIAHRQCACCQQGEPSHACGKRRTLSSFYARGTALAFRFFMLRNGNKCSRLLIPDGFVDVIHLCS